MGLPRGEVCRQAAHPIKISRILMPLDKAALLRYPAACCAGSSLVKSSLPLDDSIDEEALMREIEEAFRGQRPLSEDIIEERRNGP